MQLVFIHGWGMNSTIWQSTIAKLDGFGCQTNKSHCKTIDLGFVKGGQTDKWDSTEPTIFIGHSLGSLWALKQKQITPHAFISVAGFTNFSSFTPGDTIKKMQEGIVNNPATQMALFWRRAGCKNFAQAEDLNQIALHDGLEMLAQEEASEEFLNLTCPKCIIATKADKIVPASAIDTQWPGEKIIWHETSPHCLPKAEPEWLAEQIRAFVSEIE